MIKKTIAISTILPLVVSAANLRNTQLKKPNIIYILADDLGYGDLSCFGQTKFKTPNIDKLAARGMVFTQHYSGSSVCAPSRACLLTGLHTGHAPVRGNAERYPEGQVPMPKDTFMIPKLLKKAGYTTAAFGKWGLGAPGSTSEPLSMGFDRFFGYNCQRMSHNYYPYFLWDNDKRIMLWKNFGVSTGTYAPELIHQKLMKFIEANKTKPFFCYYAIIQPHAEMLAPEKYMEKYRGKFLPEKAYRSSIKDKNFRKGTYGTQLECHAALAAMVNCIDDYVGDVMAKLKELGIDKNTIIIFASDNGPHREGGNDPDYFNSNGPFKGYKRDLYDGGIHVPMIIDWPAKIKAGSKTNHLSAFWDVLPTIADITEQKIPVKIDGISFLPTLLGEKQVREHDYLYWEFHEANGRQAIRKGNWKGVRYNVEKNPDSQIELYDLSNDPGEENNVASDHPEVVTELTELLKSARTTNPNPKFNFHIKH
jgi:arylsulfatase A-like enzyme